MTITNHRFRAAAIGAPVLAAIAIAGCGGASTAKPTTHAAVKAAVASHPAKHAPSHPARRRTHHVHRPVAVAAVAPKPAATTQSAPAPVQSPAPAPAPPQSSAPAPAPPPTTAGIPQGNGGDMDGDNNGGPSDGDGGV